MKISLDKYDRRSILTLIISILFCFWLIYKSVHELKKDDDLVILVFSDVSSVMSIGGLIIAVLQIFKVANNTKTYQEAYEKTMATVINNESITLLSRSLQQLSMIKHLFENKQEKSSRSYFTNLSIDLTALRSNANIYDLEKKQLTKYINYCTEMDTLVYKSIIDVIQKVLSLTKDNKLKWNLEKNSSDFFSTKVGEQEISIFNTGLRYVFQVADSNKNLLGSLTDESYGSLPVPGIPGFENINQLGLPILSRPENALKELFDQAKKSALQIDKNLNDLLKTLNSLG